MGNRNGRTWPLLLIAAPAAVAIWSGWVGLGGLCGFGPVQLLPGVTDWTLNTAITLPVGVEAYAAFALGAWMAPGTQDGARTFARWSALGALGYGMAGQVIYHLLAAAHATAAPWPVVVVVSCMPVAVLGLAAALTHLLRLPAKPETASARASVSASVPGKLPSLREIQARQNCGQGTARKIRAELAAYERSRGGSDTPLAVAAAAPAAQERSRGGPVHPTPAPAARDAPAGDAPPPAHASAGALNGHGGARG